MSSAAIPSIFDTQSLAKLKGGLRQDDPQAVKAAARQFEAMLLQMMLKSMRATTPQTGMFDSDQTRFYQELLDSQLAQVMAAKGGMGIATVIERQLSHGDANSDAVLGDLPLTPQLRTYPVGPRTGIPLPDVQESPALPFGNSPVLPAKPKSAAPAASGGWSANAQAQAFVASVLPQAATASQTTGIPAHFLVAQAALETGWGKSEPRFADGRPSYNLFGIKAGAGWQGPVVEASTTEFVNGVPERRLERFRAYNSYAEAFTDYAQMLAQSPRYAGVLGSQSAAGFAQGLQRAGYATDPSYAAKLERIINGLAMSANEPSRA